MRASWVAPPHSFTICCWTLSESEPQRVLRSAGFCSVATAARRHAGGTATTSLETARRERTRVAAVKRILFVEAECLFYAVGIRTSPVEGKRMWELESEVNGQR